MKLRSRNLASLALVALLVLAGCGSDKTVGLPTVPTPPDAGGTPLPTIDPSTDPRFPSMLASSVEITLVDPINYTGLKALANLVFPPIVETFVALSYAGGRTSNVDAAILVGFEDNQGLWAGLLNSFAGASTRTSDNLDMIFSDSEFTLRVTAGIQNDNLVDARIYYRIRQSGETQCAPVTYTCVDQWGQTVQCPAGYTPPPDTSAATCKTYMNLGDSAVKQLGSFQSTYSQWIKN